MKRTLFISVFSFLLFSGFTTKAEMSFAEREKFINKHVDLAVKEMHRTGVPASIKLAQLIIESSWGTGELFVNANAGFGVKCNGRKGKSYEKIDDDRDENGNLIKSCFRGYSSIEESFIDHSDFLRSRSRYSDLFSLPQHNYKAWAYGLKKSGYATANNYAPHIIDIIETYDLYRYDYIKATPPADVRPQSTTTSPATQQAPLQPTTTETDEQNTTAPDLTVPTYNTTPTETNPIFNRRKTKYKIRLRNRRPISSMP